MEHSRRVTYQANEYVGLRPMSTAVALKDSIEKGISRSAYYRCEHGPSVKVGKVADIEHWLITPPA
jgi:hypothetical protein